MKNKIKAIRLVKPTTSGSRFTSFVNRDHLTKDKPVKSLIKKHQRGVGRDALGHVSTRHKGGGMKRKYRVISTLGQCGAGPYELVRLEYDPYRSANIALITNNEGRKFYILAPAGLTKQQKFEYGDEAAVATGNRLTVGRIPTGTEVHNLTVTPGNPAKMVRSAGNKAVIMAHENGYTLIKLPSGELRRFHDACEASIGALSNEAHNTVRLGKAGRQRLRGIRPTVRGKAMSPVAHPHGGGEGNTSIGMKAPKTPWGKRTMGVKTRRRPDRGNFIVKSRRNKRR
jgi:large subunit ribosomal protein L2